MKKRFVSCFVLALLGSLNVLAYDFESDGIYYTITGSNTVSVVSGDYVYDGDVTIPQAVGLSGKTYLVTAIGENAFKSATNLESVTLPEGLIIIGNQAFYQSGVKTVSLPSTLSSMGTSAFRECTNLQGIVLPDALKDIKEYAFYGCTNMKTLVFGVQTVTIEKYAFSNTSIENLIIPISVKSIGAHSFEVCKNLKSMIIENAPVTIGAGAFADCTELENVSLGNAVQKFESESGYVNELQGAFKGCVSLKSIEIPQSVSALEGTFYGCSRLYDVKLPNTLSLIGRNTFFKCAIERIDIPNTVTIIDNEAFSGCPLKEITLPSSLKTIGIKAFSGHSLSELIIPQSIISIGHNAFEGSNTLKTVKIENAAISLINTFANCTSLTNVDLGNAILSLEGKALNYNNRFVTVGVFNGCTSLCEISIPNSVKTITSSCFNNCTNLSTVLLSNTLTEIGDNAFYGCTNLKSLNLPNTLQTLGTGVFRGCILLDNIVFPESLNSIGSYAFFECTSLREIIIPENVKSMAEYSFYGCTNLESVVFDNTIVSIQERAFQSCTNLKTLELGKVTAISNDAFADCVSLTDVVIPNSVEGMYSAFPNCTSLRKITIGTGLKALYSYDGYNGCFTGCSKLSNVIIKSNVLTEIQYNTFKNCRSLKTIELPASVTTIAKSCFEGCSVLSHIYMNPITPPAIQANTFTDYETPTLHVPSSAKTAYTKADNWKQFTNIVAIGSEPKATAEEIAALDALLGDAQALYNAAVEGTEPGNYRAGAKAALKAVINEVSARIVDNMLKEDVEDCTELLNTAIRSFKNKQVKNEYQTDNTLAFASSLKASRGAEFRLPIEMNNVNEISAVQFDLYLPEGMLLSTDEYGDYQIELGDRTTARRHSVSSRVMSDGALRVVVSSTQNATFTGNSGTLLSLVLFPQTTMEAGDYDVELKNIVLTDPQATRYAAVDMKSVVTVSAYTMGDVNNDTHIDVADLTGVVLFILENADASLVFNAADMDGNGVVEVNDYAALVNVILAQNAPAGSRMSGKMEIYPNIISLSDMMVNENGEGELIVNLINKDRSYTGLQFDLYLPEGIQLNTETAEAVGRHHGIWAQKHADGYYRVICSSTMNDELNEGAVMRLQVKAANDMQGTYRLQAGNVVLSDANAQRHEAANAGAQLMIGDEATGIVSVETAKQLKNVYDMQGRRVNAVKKGVYMVNGKKVVVR